MSLRALPLALATIAAVFTCSGMGATQAQAKPCLEIGFMGFGTEVDFGYQKIPSVSSKSATLTNNCGKEIEVVSVTETNTSGYKKVSDGCKGAKLKPEFLKDTCSIKYEFDPSLAIKYEMTTHVTYEGAGVAKDTLSFFTTGRGTFKRVWNATGALQATGALTLSSGGNSITCDVLAQGEIWNEEEAAGGEFAEFDFEACEASFPCSVTGATALELPWDIAGAEFEEAPLVEVSGIKTTFTTACSTITAEGTVNGSYDNSTSCVEFEETSGLTVQGGTPATLDGEVCVTEPENLELE